MLDGAGLLFFLDKIIEVTAEKKEEFKKTDKKNKAIATNYNNFRKESLNFTSKNLREKTEKV